MADHPTGPSEIGAPMDYREHEATYSKFLTGAKWLSILVAALLIAMAAGFFGHAGWIGSGLVFLVLGVGGIFLT
jgi:hypothetical protein